MLKQLGIGFAAFTLGLAVPAVAETAADRAHIHDVETGLLPGIVIMNRPSQAMSLAEGMKLRKVPGVSIAFFEQGHIVWTRAYGYADVAARRAVTPETMFQAGSISKPLAALAALRLVQDGKLSLDENVNARLRTWHVPDNTFTASEKVTLRRLLSHTAGLSVHGFEGYQRGSTLPSLVQILNGEKPAANNAPVVVTAMPGSAWNYSGGGYVVAELLMTETTGVPFATLMRKSVLEPAHMSRSTYEQPLPDALLADASLAYRGSGMPTTGGSNVYPEQTAAGLWTTPSDLARLMIEVQKEVAGKSSKILSPAMARAMLTPVMANWGLGWNVLPDGRFGHDGQNVGFNDSLIAYTTGTGQGVAIMTNADGGAVLEQAIMRAVAKSYGWKAYQPEERTAIAVDPATLATYDGSYDISGLARIAISTSGDHFYLQTNVIGPDPVDIYCDTPTTFFAPAIGLFGTFVAGPDGKVSALQLKTPIGAFEAKRAP